jgi:hypothetical protein
MQLNMDPGKLQRHRAFFHHQPADRPLIGSWLFGFFVHQQYPSVAAAMQPGPIRPEDIPIELFLKDVDALWEAYNELDDDYPFSMGAFYGVPWLEAIMGCPVHFSGTNLYASACITDWNSYDWTRPTLDNPWARKLLEFLEALVRHSAGRFACGPTLMRGPADMCSAMRGGTNLALDLYDCPDNVRRLAELCADVWIEVGKAQLDLVPESENGYVIGCAGLRCWMPEKGVWLQDDALSVLSPRFYDGIFLSQVRRIAAQFPCVAFHLHGNTLWPVDLLLPVDEIDVLELNYDVGVCQLEKLIPAWKKIQARKPCLAFADVTLDELEQILGELPPAGLSLQTISPTMENARAKRDLVYRRGTAST